MAANNVLKDDIALMAELSTILNHRYNKRGRFVVYTPELRIDVDKNGKPLKVYEKEINKATELIENFMIVCNETIADYMVHNCLPCIFRIHEPIKEEKLNEFIQLLNYKIDNFKSNILSKPKEIFSFLDDSRVSKDDRLIREIFIRILEKAIYSPQNIGHFGMASETYLHFTSPIRRYPDLYIHRIIKNFLNGNMEQINCMEQQLKLICSRCNENERVEVKTKSEVFKYGFQSMSQPIGTGSLIDSYFKVLFLLYQHFLFKINCISAFRVCLYRIQVIRLFENKDSMQKGHSIKKEYQPQGWYSLGGYN